MMKSLKAGFTLAEVLTTLMVIGVVAAMTVPTLINSTDDQQNRAAIKKSASVLGQAVQLLVAKEVECPISNGADASADLAECLSNVMTGTLNDDTITTPDGMLYRFYAVNSTGGDADFSTICGDGNFGSSAADWLGADRCGVVVDINGATKGTRGIADDDYAFDADGFGQINNGTKDQFPLILSSIGVRPVYQAGLVNKGYNYLYGQPAQDSDVINAESVQCCDYDADAEEGQQYTNCRPVNKADRCVAPKQVKP